MNATKGTVACAACGALNGGDFGTCIRCNQPLEGAVAADRVTARVAAVRRRERAPAVGQQRSVEKLLGRWSVEQLPVTRAIVALNVVVFVLQVVWAMGGAGVFDAVLTGGTGFDAYRFGAMPMTWELVALEPWRLVSACFVHFGILHIGFNMMALIHFSRFAEPAIGSIRYAIGYILTGLIGFALSLFWAELTGAAGMTAGASGAVFGVDGLILGVLWRQRDTRWKPWAIQGVLMLALMSAFPGINNAAHVGGALAGVALGALFAPGAPRRSHGWQRVVALLLSLGCVGSLVAARLSPAHDILRQAVEAQQSETPAAKRAPVGED